MDGGATRKAAELTREEIYALVWEHPLNRVGPDLGLDGPRLAKLCDKRQIPYPPPGYWSKKAVGRAPAAPPLPPDPGPASEPTRAPRARISKQREDLRGLKPPAVFKAEAKTPPPRRSLSNRLYPSMMAWTRSTSSTRRSALGSSSMLGSKRNASRRTEGGEAIHGRGQNPSSMT